LDDTKTLCPTRLDVNRGETATGEVKKRENNGGCTEEPVLRGIGFNQILETTKSGSRGATDRSRKSQRLSGSRENDIFRGITRGSGIFSSMKEKG